LIRTGWLSPALVFGQPDFLRPCHNIRAPKDTFLHFYAADSRVHRTALVGGLRRTQILRRGYALANRLVTSRILRSRSRQ